MDQRILLVGHKEIAEEGPGHVVNWGQYFSSLTPYS